MSGQSIVDRLNAAKHTVAGSALGRAVVKATTEEIMGPKRKHLEYLLQCTSEINVSIPQMADLLIERTQNTSWVVTYKALITIHHLMCYGNERFSQYMASHNSKFSLNNFMDKTGIQGIDMSSYIRKYAHYLNEKRETYKLMGFDFCKVKRGKDDGMLRTMAAEKLLKTLPILQKQLDALVQFDIQANELTNGVINSSFILMSKDLIRLFACYNDGIINLLEKFFDMNKKSCKEALDIYKKFLERTDSVSAFLKVAESSGMDKSDIPDLAKAPNSLLEALEAHVNGPETKKSSSNVSAAATNSNQAKSSAAVSSAISSLNNNTSLLSAEEKRRVLEEEAKTLEQFKSSHLKKQTSVSSPTNENPFGNPITKTTTTSNQDDLFGLDLTSSTTFSNNLNNNPSSNSTTSASDDLLMLSGANPFMQSYNTAPQQQSSMGVSMNANPFQLNGQNQMNLFQQSANFPMSNQNKIVFNNFAPMSGNYYPVLNYSLNPFNNNYSNNIISNNNSNSVDLFQAEFDAFGDVLQPTNKNTALNPTPLGATKSSSSNGLDKHGEQKILSTDLESSLASLADNLDINHKNKNFQKNHQWNANVQQNQLKTGGQNWKGPAGQTINQVPSPVAPMAASWNTTPMGVNPIVSPMNTGWNANPFAASVPQPNQMGMQQKFVQAPIQQAPPIRPAVQSSNPFDLF